MIREPHSQGLKSSQPHQGVPDRKDKNPEDRALLVLKYLNCICDLYIDNLIKREHGCWEVVTSQDNTQNPLGNNFESLAHLLANITQFQFDVELYARTPWIQPQLIGRLRCHI